VSALKMAGETTTGPELVSRHHPGRGCHAGSVGSHGWGVVPVAEAARWRAVSIRRGPAPTMPGCAGTAVEMWDWRRSRNLVSGNTRPARGAGPLSVFHLTGTVVLDVRSTGPTGTVHILGKRPGRPTLARRRPSGGSGARVTGLLLLVLHPRQRGACGWGRWRSGRQVGVGRVGAAPALGLAVGACAARARGRRSRRR
jgi:hypothetical protein